MPCKIGIAVGLRLRVAPARERTVPFPAFRHGVISRGAIGVSARAMPAMPAVHLRIGAGLAAIFPSASLDRGVSAMAALMFTHDFDLPVPKSKQFRCRGLAIAPVPQESSLLRLSSRAGVSVARELLLISLGPMVVPAE
jgi:hypothetical protein